jgi:hypothetical protein
MHKNITFLITGNTVADNILTSAAGYASSYVPFYVLHHKCHWYEDKTESYWQLFPH